MENEARPTGKKKIAILGGGPNRIGQGIEFDYCCVHAVQALREDGYETIMINCNPETVSTDYDTSDRLYFEPLTREDVLEILDVEKPEGVIVQFGGQTPLRLAVPLLNAGVKLLGTSADAIDRAEDRQRFGELLQQAGPARARLGHRPRPRRGAPDRRPHRLPGDGAPVVRARRARHGDRPRSLGPGALRLHRHGGLAPREPVDQVGGRDAQDTPILIDQFLPDAIEVDVDVVADGTEQIIGGVMEHIEEAGIHSGDSACACRRTRCRPRSSRRSRPRRARWPRSWACSA